MHDEKMFICVIRSCFEDKEAEIYRVKSNDQPTLDVYPNNYPSIGGMQLYLQKPTYIGSCSSHSDSIFGVKGNELTGGKEYKDTDCGWFDAQIEHFQVFKISE